MTANEKLISVHAALNQIEVRGKGNLNLMLGTIAALEEIMLMLSNGELKLVKGEKEAADGQLYTGKEGV